MNPIYIVWELIDDLIGDLERICCGVARSPVPYLGFGFGAVIVTWLLLGRSDGGDFLSVAFWSRDPEGMRNLLWALATIAAGAAGLYGLSLAARRTKTLDEQARIAEENRKLSEQAQITDRFTRAVEQLGHENRSVRLGAIYALERIAKDSERDFDVIMGTLAAYARVQAPFAYKQSSSPAVSFDAFNVAVETPDIGADYQKQFEKYRPSVDVEAALLVLSRVIPRNHPLRTFRRIDLRFTDLRGLDLPQSDFSGFRFDFSNFDGANLIESSLRNVSLNHASLNAVRLEHSDLTEATLKGATLIRSQLSDAILTKANLSECELLRTNLWSSECVGSSFRLANLAGAHMGEGNFSGSNFFAATMWGVQAHNSNFTSVDMGHVDLAGSFLQNACFRLACLIEGCLVHANVRDSIFEGAQIDEADFLDVTGLESSQLSSAGFVAGHPPVNLPNEISG
ncbi:MAG: pentapeptide repeat-containing protein [Rhodobiaceae bacterium]|nr:pentapeptide repeat-containing protein [Rhodobiaceae bacterium]